MKWARDKIIFLYGVSKLAITIFARDDNENRREDRIDTRA